MPLAKAWAIYEMRSFNVDKVGSRFETLSPRAHPTTKNLSRVERVAKAVEFRRNAPPCFVNSHVNRESLTSTSTCRGMTHYRKKEAVL